MNKINHLSDVIQNELTEEEQNYIIPALEDYLQALKGKHNCPYCNAQQSNSLYMREGIMNNLKCTSCNNVYLAVGTFNIVNVSTYQRCNACHRALGDDCVC